MPAGPCCVPPHARRGTSSSRYLAQGQRPRLALQRLNSATPNDSTAPEQLYEIAREVSNKSARFDEQCAAAGAAVRRPARAPGPTEFTRPRPSASLAWPCRCGAVDARERVVVGNTGIGWMPADAMDGLPNEFCIRQLQRDRASVETSAAVDVYSPRAPLAPATDATRGLENMRKE